MSKLRRDDAGIALLTVLMVGAVLSALGIVVVTTTVNNLAGAGRDRAGASALSVAEAGVADAISYMKNKGVRSICDACTTPYNVSSPVTRTYKAGNAVVSIKVLSAYQPPATRAGRYLVSSVAQTPQSRPGKRTIQQTVEVKPLSFPLGVYVNGHLNINGSVQIQQESVFSSSCIDSRDHLLFSSGPTGSGIDPFNNIPAGAHSVSYITTKQIQTCALSISSADSSAIHRTSACASSYPYDQDGLGKPFGASDTYCSSRTTGYGDYDTKGSGFDNSTMVDTYGYTPRGLSDDQYAELKARAQAAGTYFPAGTTVTWPTASTNVNDPGYSPVIYIEDQSVTVNNQLNSYAWTSDPTCSAVHPNFILVVARGDLSIGSSAAMTGYLFAPDGTVSDTGGASITGTIFSKDLKLGGGGSAGYNVGLNECFASYANGGILGVSKVRFREADGGYNE